MKAEHSWIRRSQRVIRMVSELHRLGFQHLRIMPYEYPLAWRLCIGPRRLFSKHNGAFMPSSSGVTYTSASENQYFDWKDTAADNARTLADKFIERFPREAEAGRGRDWEYAGWLAELIGELEKGGRLPLVTAEALDVQPYSLTRLPWIDYASGHSIEMQFPLPPGGDLDDPVEEHRGTLAPAGLAAALAQAAKPNYLGNPGIVRQIVDEFISLSIAQKIDEVLTDMLAEKEFEVGRIFAGEEPGYTPVGPWNSPEQLGQAIHRCFGTSLDLIAEENFVLFIVEGICAVRDAAQRFMGSKAAVAAIAGYATAVLVGHPVKGAFKELLEWLPLLPPDAG